MAEDKICSELVKKLKRGQKHLERSLRRLENDGAVAVERRKKQQTRRFLSEKPVYSLRDLPRKRARIDLLSPSTEYKTRSVNKHPRRLSSTPKKNGKQVVSFSIPEVDTSLEEALLNQSSTPHRLPSPKLSQVEVNTSRRLTDHQKPPSQSFLHRSSYCKPPKRGLSVCFVDGNEENTKSRTSASKQGQGLIESLNASKNGALDRTLSTSKRRFPRQYAGDDPKLGYDWIAGLIDASDTYLNERDECYFEDLKEFRRVNCSECSKPKEESPVNITSGSRSGAFSLDTTGLENGSDNWNSSCKTCIRSYSINNRLFPIPRHMHPQLAKERGLLETTCPVCEDKHRDDKSPTRYIKVSVPKRTLQSSYRLRPHRRRSFDPDDSLGLSKHCLAGWENAQPSIIPSQPNVGLKSAVGREQPQPLSSSELLNTSHTADYYLKN